MNRVPPPDDAAHADGRLMHELARVNSVLARYVLRHLDADAGRTPPTSVDEERALAKRLTAAAADLLGRAARRQQRGVLDDLRHRHRRDPTLLDDSQADLGLRRLTGGRHNWVLAWTGPDGDAVCLKLYRTDNRDRADREYQALAHVAACGITAAPRPLWHDPDPELPAVAMALAPGQPVLDLAEPTAALRAAVGVLVHLHGIPLGSFANLPRVHSATDVIARITRVWPGPLDEAPDAPVTADMRSVLDAWHDLGDAAVLAEPAARVFSRGDANLLNWLWDGSDVRVVDWEFAGYSDTAYEAADLVEHISAHAIDDEVWISLLPILGVTDTATRRRFLAAQRTVALRWLSVLWKRRHTRADEFEFQVRRVRDLMTQNFL